MDRTRARRRRATVAVVRAAAVVLSTSLGLAVAGCGEPTREAQVERHLSAAMDHLALRRWRGADAQLDRALRLDPGSADARHLRALLVEASRRVVDEPALEREAFVGGLDLTDVGTWTPRSRGDRTDVDLVARATLPALVAHRLDPSFLRAVPGEHMAVTDVRRVVASRKVTLHFAGVALVEVVSFLSDVTGLLFVVPPWLEEVRVTLRVRDVLLVDALALVAEATGTYLRLGAADKLTFS